MSCRKRKVTVHIQLCWIRSTKHVTVPVTWNFRNVCKAYPVMNCRHSGVMTSLVTHNIIFFGIFLWQSYMSYCAIKLKISAVTAVAKSWWCSTSPSILCLHSFNRSVKVFWEILDGLYFIALFHWAFAKSWIRSNVYNFETIIRKVNNYRWNLLLKYEGINAVCCEQTVGKQFFHIASPCSLIFLKLGYRFASHITKFRVQMCYSDSCDKR